MLLEILKNINNSSKYLELNRRINAGENLSCFGLNEILCLQVLNSGLEVYLCRFLEINLWYCGLYENLEIKQFQLSLLCPSLVHLI